MDRYDNIRSNNISRIGINMTGPVEYARAHGMYDHIDKNDPVNSPLHYTQGGVECFDAIQASMTTKEFCGFLKGNAMKYIWRYNSKGNANQDLDKANWYLTRLRTLIKKETQNAIPK